MNVPSLLESAGSKICYMEFEKRNGDKRCMWGISKIKHSLLSGGPRAYNPTEHRITIVRDIHLSDEDCLRAVRWDAITLISVNRKTYVRDEEGKLHVTRRPRPKGNHTKV